MPFKKLFLTMGVKNIVENECKCPGGYRYLAQLG